MFYLFYLLLDITELALRAKESTELSGRSHINSADIVTAIQDMGQDPADLCEFATANRALNPVPTGRFPVYPDVLLISGDSNNSVNTTANIAAVGAGAIYP